MNMAVNTRNKHEISASLLSKSNKVAARSMDKPGTPGAILLGGAHGSLALARAFGRRGIPVLYLAAEQTFTAASRYVRELRWPVDDDDSRVSYLLELGKRCGLQGWVLFPACDVDARFLSKCGSRLERIYRVVAPPWDSLQQAYDKRLTNQAAEKLGIAIPWTAYPRNHDELATLDCPFPCILKPSVKEHKNAFTQAKAWRADNRSQLLGLYDRAASLVPSDTIMVQENIPGSGATQLSYAAAWWNCEPLASLVARRVRQYPVDFGYSSTCVETTQAPEVEDASIRILRAMEYRGLVEVEFKFDVRDHQYKLLDINPRCWTWQALAARAGVDFGYLLWLAAQGRPVPAMQARQGTRWFYVSRDVIAAAVEIGRGTTSVGSYLKSLFGLKSYAVFAVDDPLPALLELPLLLPRVRNRRAVPTGRMPSATPVETVSADGSLRGRLSAGEATKNSRGADVSI
jgi:D-aspartate ligase